VVEIVLREDVGDRAPVGGEIVVAERAGLVALVGEDKLPGERGLLVARAPDERRRPRPPSTHMPDENIECREPVLDLGVLDRRALVEDVNVHAELLSRR